MSLVTEPNIADPDAIYEALIAAHDGLSVEASAALNARLVLILMNHVGDADILHAALRLAAAAEDGA